MLNLSLREWLLITSDIVIMNHMKIKRLLPIQSLTAESEIFSVHLSCFFIVSFSPLQFFSIFFLCKWTYRLSSPEATQVLVWSFFIIRLDNCNLFQADLPIITTRLIMSLIQEATE